MKKYFFNTVRKIALVFGLLTLLTACNFNGNSKKDKTSADSLEIKGLKDYYNAYFPVGVAVEPHSLTGESADLIKREYNTISPENVMKMGNIHPEKDWFAWQDTDRLVQFARENDMKLRGHALVWHQQHGDWIFKDADDNEVDKEELFARMKTHIDSVMHRYKDDIYAWDVVNEAVSDKPGEVYRLSEWLEIGGKEFLVKAFQYAREADPEAKLFYNDYDAIFPHKRDKIIELIKYLQENDAPIDGIGIQAHWTVFGPSEEILRETLDKYAALGLEIQITELDVSIHKKEHQARERNEEDSDEFTEQLQKQQKEMYAMIFKVFREYKDVITNVTFWGVSDKDSWLNYFPVEGRKDYPLLFNANLKPKEAYRIVSDF